MVNKTPESSSEGLSPKEKPSDAKIRLRLEQLEGRVNSGEKPSERPSAIEKKETPEVVLTALDEVDQTDSKNEQNWVHTVSAAKATTTIAAQAAERGFGMQYSI